MAATQRKPASSTKKTSSKKTSTSRSGSSGRKKGTTGKNSGHQRNNQYGMSRYKDEITIVITLVVAVILVLSNFNLSGSVGSFINRFTFGMFGLLAYILPYLLFFGIAFHISNKGNYTAIIKLVSSICLVCVVAAFIQLVTMDYNSEWKIFNYYTASASNKNGGGFIGGLIYSIMYPLFGFAGTLVILLAIMTLLIMFITERLLFASLGKKSAVKYKEMKARRVEVKKAREEAYYSEEYNDYSDEDEIYEETEPRQIRRGNVKNADKSIPLDSSKSKKGERKKKAKTFTFPGVGTNIDASEQNQETMSNDNIEPIHTAAEGTAVTTPSAPLDEVKPFDFDSIPIYRGDQSNYDYNDTPIYKEEMKRKFSQKKDYDIKKLAEQIMNESFDDNSTKVDKKATLASTDVEETKTTLADNVLDGTMRLDSMSSMNDSTRDQSQIQDQTLKLDSNENEQVSDNFGHDVVYKEETRYSNEADEADELESTTSNDQLEEDNYDNFRVDLKALENEEVDEVFSHSSNLEANQLLTPNQEGDVSSNINHKDHGEKKEITDTTQVETAIEEVEEEFVYEFPPLELLARPKKSSKGVSNGELKETAIKLQQTLQSFGVGVTITNVSCGPAVTRYELQPEQGVKVSKITNLADDIKLNLAAADIRIEAPIPGKAAVGIEVPNKENSAVMFRELIEGKEFMEHGSNLAFAVGKDIGGQVVVTDIAKMPHLLIAGATGSGKSVCINTLIMSILYKAHPDDVKLIMVDPKVVELSVYNGIPHLLIPVVTDPKKASAALNWAVMEMTDRYNRFAELGVRDIKGYNAKIEKVEEYNDEKFKKMPQIVIIVDELADLMMVAPGEVEDAICRLAQMARAAGIHLIIATQRPSVNVITGLIKANVPSRIAFSVSSAIDSRTIIDGSGAEKLLGKGDMLFFPSGYPKPVRIQGAFVSDKEVSEVVEFLSSQRSKPSYNEDITNKITSSPSSEGSTAPANDRDDYFVEAGKFIIEKDKASIGMLQRVYKIGFNRAARIMDQLYEAGVVGPEEGTKPRKVLMSEEEFEQYIDEYV